MKLNHSQLAYASVYITHCFPSISIAIKLFLNLKVTILPMHKVYLRGEKLVTYRLVHYRSKWLQHLSHIELYVGYPVKFNFQASSPSFEKKKKKKVGEGKRHLPKPSLRTQQLHLSFAALMTTGRSFEHVISGPITGARREIAWRMVIRYR